MISINNAPVPHLQSVWEFDTFIKHIYKPLNASSILEIGSFFGGTLWSYIVNNPDLKQIISVDMLIGPEDGRYNQMIESRKKWSQWIITIDEVLGDSHKQETLYKVTELIKYKVDMLFIDGDHSYEGVKQDYEMYSPLVREGGIIAFHDSVGYDSVAKFCKELKEQEGSKFLEINQKNGWGIFILEKS